MVQFLAARVALVRDFQEGAKHVALAAGWASAAEAIPKVSFEGVVAHAG
jgi:hypothetical protein